MGRRIHANSVLLPHPPHLRRPAVVTLSITSRCIVGQCGALTPETPISGDR
jgi:hypothetical protein